MFANALKQTTLEARKNKDPMATFLVSVTSKATNLAKAENPQASTYEDDHALAAINKSLKEAEDNIQMLEEKERTDSPLYEQSKRERDLLKGLLPQEASDEEVRREVELFVEAADTSAGRNKLMGPVMKHINEKFGASLNKKKASAIVQSVLNA